MLTHADHEDVTNLSAMSPFSIFQCQFTRSSAVTWSQAHAYHTQLSYIRCCSLSPWQHLRNIGRHCLLETAASFLTCVCVCVFFPGALPSLVLFLVWCFWWGPWQPYSCACACAWRTGVVHGLACSAPPITSALWPRAIQVGQYTQPHNLMCPIPCLCYIYFKIHEVNWILTAYKGQEN